MRIGGWGWRLGDVPLDSTASSSSELPAYSTGNAVKWAVMLVMHVLRLLARPYNLNPIHKYMTVTEWCVLFRCRISVVYWVTNFYNLYRNYGSWHSVLGIDRLPVKMAAVVYCMLMLIKNSGMERSSVILFFWIDSYPCEYLYCFIGWPSV